MNREKLTETRGEEPAFLPGHVGESWERIDYGLGASSTQSSPKAQESPKGDLTIAKTNARRSMMMILCIFIGIFAYKLVAHGLKEAKSFAPLIIIWLIACLVVYWITKNKGQSHA